MSYDRGKGPDNNVDNIMMMHSSRPRSMEEHMVIYKYVLPMRAAAYTYGEVLVFNQVNDHFNYANRTCWG